MLVNITKRKNLYNTRNTYILINPRLYRKKEYMADMYNNTYKNTISIIHPHLPCTTWGLTWDLKTKRRVSNIYIEKKIYIALK